MLTDGVGRHPMTLTQPDALRILRFCLGADDSGSATVRPDGGCVITIALCRSSYEVRAFEGDTFEESLRSASSAGALKAACVDKQIAFLSRREPGDEATSPLPEPATEEVTLVEEAHAVSPFLSLAGVVHSLLHETQRERGLSTMFTASRGRLQGSELTAQWRRTDQRRKALTDLVRTEGQIPPRQVLYRIDRAQTLLTQLGTMRRGVEDLVVTAPQVIDAYTAVNAELLATLDAYMVAGVDTTQRSGALACVALLYAKERAGGERAQLTDAFFKDRFSEGQRLSVAALIAAQSSYLHIFSTAAPRAAEQLLRRLMASPTATDVQRMESIVYSPNDGGFGIDATAWFKQISKKIDMLGDVSTTVLALLRDHEQQ
jgi:Nitrate and nitrite sensing